MTHNRYIRFPIMLSDMENKRVRAPNFSTEEKTLLLNLVFEKRHIVENKKTDAVSSREKQKCWEGIASEFNAQSPSCVSRTANSLLKFYNNKKKEVRKEVAQEKFSLRKTGGGEPSYKKKVNDPVFEITLATMNEVSVFGLPTTYGDDRDLSEDDTHRQININKYPSSPIVTEELSCGAENTFDVGSSTHPTGSGVPSINEDKAKKIFKNPLHKTLQKEKPQNENAINKENNENLDWGDFKASHLKKPRNPKLIPNCGRRRPMVKNLHTSHISETYDDLAKMKKELVQKQIESQVNDENRKEHEFQLRKELLQLDIEIKKQYLKKLVNTSNLKETNFSLFN
ncbi:hypothetical protein FQR65_LT19403 [Abscondita terminalis]|nr:hypothetical protein FQR65_LT19403 [Abscondita terminalis]